MKMNTIVCPPIDELLKARARLLFFQRRLEIARRFDIPHAIKGYEAHVKRSLDLLWFVQEKVRWLAEHESLHREFFKTRALQEAADANGWPVIDIGLQ